jgi:hypothetical protein
MPEQVAIQLNLRSRWMTYALDAETAAKTVAAEVDALTDRHPDVAPRRPFLIDLLSGESAGARAEEAVFGALRYEEHPVHDGSVVTMSGWLVGRDPSRRADRELGDSLARFAVRSRADQFPPQAARIALPYGDCVRVDASRQLPAARLGPNARAGTASARFPRTVFRTVEYHVPLDQPVASLLFIRFMTSNLGHAEMLADEYHALVADLQVLPSL